MTNHLRVRIPSPTSLVSLRCLVVSVCVRRQTDGLRERDSHDEKYNDDDDDGGGDQHNISFQFINLQAIITSAYYTASTKKQNTKTIQIHRNKTKKN